MTWLTLAVGKTPPLFDIPAAAWKDTLSEVWLLATQRYLLTLEIVRRTEADR